ncbi:MAG: hypothetical protein WCY41_03465 [Candidatus Micrarchaeia archaeon]
MEEWQQTVVIAVIALFIGDIIHPIGIVNALANPPYLSVQGDGSALTVVLRNRGDVATQMMYRVTADSESIHFAPSNDTTDTVSVHDERVKDFIASIDGPDGSYTYVVHAYVNSTHGWDEVANETRTLPKKA